MRAIGAAGRFRLGAAALVAAATPGLAIGGPVIGGFTAGRGGSFALAHGDGVAGLRGSIAAAFPGSVFTETDALTGAYLGTIDVLIISSASSGVTAITPLSAQEQAALTAFVAGGHAAILLTDNDTFAGAGSSPANQSLVSPFGCRTTGTGAPWAVQVTATPAPPLTSGPFGPVGTFSVGWSGWYDQLGAAVESAAAYPAGGGAVLALIRRGRLGACSGPVVFFADSTLAFDGYFNAASGSLINNAIAYAMLGCADCYSNCDGSTIAPVLNVNDFTCFLNRYAIGDSYANCDGSTISPILNVNDFTCFVNRYAAGCP